MSDLKSGEIVEQLRAPQNAVPYHLKHPRDLELLRNRRSTADARDVYYSLDLDRLQALYTATGDVLHIAAARANHADASPTTANDTGANHPLRVLFLCTHNSARSQLAEGITRYLGGDAVEVSSAGSESTAVHPYALLEGWGICIVRRELMTRIRYVLNLPHPATGRHLPIQCLVRPELTP